MNQTILIIAAIFGVLWVITLYPNLGKDDFSQILLKVVVPTVVSGLVGWFLISETNWWQVATATAFGAGIAYYIVQQRATNLPPH